ncbi:9469_t:CDS:1, partial [Acaulospora colombiana]
MQSLSFHFGCKPPCAVRLKVLTEQPNTKRLHATPSTSPNFSLIIKRVSRLLCFLTAFFISPVST